MLHHKHIPETSFVRGVMKGNFTHPKNRRIIWHLRRWLVIFRRSRRRNDYELLHITSPKHNILVDLVRSRDLFDGVAFPSFCAVGCDAFERDGMSVAVDFVECADVFDIGFGDEGDSAADVF